MTEGRTTSCWHVVALVRDVPAFRCDASDLGAVPFRCAVFSSAYQAAAELLARPVAALVMELGLIGRRHVQLLELARGLNVPMLGVGALPTDLTAGDLAGVRLIARADLAAELGRLIQTPQPSQAAPTCPLPPTQPDQLAPDDPAYRSDRSPPLPSDQDAPRPIAAPEQAPGPAEAPPPSPAAPAPAGPYAPAAAPAGRYEPLRPSELLTAEEIAALLENQP